jgi:hypothetical protein
MRISERRGTKSQGANHYGQTPVLSGSYFRRRLKERLCGFEGRTSRYFAFELHNGDTERSPRLRLKIELGFQPQCLVSAGVGWKF